MKLKKQLKILEEFRGKKKKDILSDFKSIGSIKYYFIVVMEGCVDIANHILAKEHFGIPKTYAECFKILSDNKIITFQLSDNLIKMAKFRNLLVHLYWKVDPTGEPLPLACPPIFVAEGRERGEGKYLLLLLYQYIFTKQKYIDAIFISD